MDHHIKILSHDKDYNKVMLNEHAGSKLKIKEKSGRQQVENKEIILQLIFCFCFLLLSFVLAVENLIISS